MQEQVREEQGVLLPPKTQPQHLRGLLGAKGKQLKNLVRQQMSSQQPRLQLHIQVRWQITTHEICNQIAD
jgi:hypothetical protein